jgi:hemerythrin
MSGERGRTRDKADWNGMVRAGERSMNADHRVELALLDALHEAVSRDLGPNRVDEILDQLLEHADVHFMSEQLLMRLTAYPQYEAHSEEHSRLLDRVRTLAGQVASGQAQSSLAIIDSMREGLVAHMDTRDRELAAYLSGNARTPPIVS